VRKELASAGTGSKYSPQKLAEVNHDSPKDSGKRLTQMTNNDYTVKGEE